MLMKDRFYTVFKLLENLRDQSLVALREVFFNFEQIMTAHIDKRPKRSMKNFYHFFGIAAQGDTKKLKKGATKH